MSSPEQNYLSLFAMRYPVGKDIWNGGFPENREILFTLFVNAIFVCNVPNVKKNRPELIPFHIIGLWV